MIRAKRVNWSLSEELQLVTRILFSSYDRTASLQAPSKTALRHTPSKDKMLEMLQRIREQYQGHPQGKRLDALLRLLLWCVAQLITDEAVKTAPDRGKQVLLNLRAVGNAAKTSTDVRATSCCPSRRQSRLMYMAAESRPDRRVLGRVLRASGVLTQFGIATDEDTVPTSKQANLSSKLLSERRVDQPRKPKKGKS